MATIFPAFFCALIQALTLMGADETVKVGQPLVERAYTRGHISASSETPSQSVSMAAKATTENKSMMTRSFFIE